MERRKESYSIQKRPTKRKNRFMFYVKFRDPETDEYLNAVSSVPRQSISDQVVVFLNDRIG